MVVKWIRHRAEYSNPKRQRLEDGDRPDRRAIVPMVKGLRRFLAVDVLDARVRDQPHESDGNIEDQ